MLAYIVRRILLMFPTLVGITLILFLMARFAPGLTGGGAFGEGSARASKQDRELAIRNLEIKLNMRDKDGNMIPLPQQYITWLWNAFHLEFGESVKYNEKVSTLILDKAPVTLTMNVIETFVVYFIAVPGGMLAAVKRGKTFDSLWGFITLAFFSVPVILLGSMMVFLLCNPQNLNWFPSNGIHDLNYQTFSFWHKATDYLWHLILPVFIMSLGGFAYLSKMMRASLLDNFSQDFVRTARAKGVSSRRILTHHVLRNSLLPMITIFAGVIPGLLGGSVIIESIFSISGMGQLAYTATLSRDLPVLQAIIFIGTIVSLVCLLLQDICYAIVDPRVSYD
jgi:peptide/nickel transport system permease protein